jgi:hypothetical protein
MTLLCLELNQTVPTQSENEALSRGTNGSNFENGTYKLHQTNNFSVVLKQG